MGPCHDSGVSTSPLDTVTSRDGCRRWQVLVAHGAGSTVTTARSLLAPILEPALGTSIHWSGIEDRTGDVDHIAGRIQRWLHRTPVSRGPRLVCGISLGAHAAILSHSRGERRRLRSDPAAEPEGYVVALPAWIGAPDAVAEATAQTGLRIAADGVESTLALIESHTPEDRRWLITTLRHDWAQYSRRQLAASLITASRTRAPDRADLESIPVPTLVIAATRDPLHPLTVARSWSSALRAASLAEIDFPEIPGFACERSMEAASAFAARLA